MNDSSDNVEINPVKNEHAVRLLLTNARWLRPKIKSLVDAFASLGLNVACITESWYKNEAQLRDHLTDLEGATGICVIHRSRDGCTKRAGGGVAVAFNTTTCNLKTRNLKI